MTRSTKLLLTVALLLGVTSVVVLCVTKRNSVVVPPIQEEKPMDEVKLSDIDTSDWKTYRNEEYGFEFKYPKEYTIRENDEWPRFFQTYFSSGNDDLSELQVKILANGKSVEPENIHLDSFYKSEIYMDNQKAYLFILKNGYCDGPSCSHPIVAVKLLHDNRFYILEFHNVTRIEEEIPNRVINSFHFLP